MSDENTPMPCCTHLCVEAEARCPDCGCTIINPALLRVLLLRLQAALPAAVPVVDVEKAARAFQAIADGELGSSIEDDARAILEAGCVGAVSMEDVRRVALTLQDVRCDETVIAAAKRLLAAVEGK